MEEACKIEKIVSTVNVPNLNVPKFMYMLPLLIRGFSIFRPYLSVLAIMSNTVYWQLSSPYTLSAKQVLENAHDLSAQ